MSLVISSTSLEEAEAQLQERIDDTNKLLDDNMVFLVDTYVIPEVKAAARAANVPQGFVDGIKFIKTGHKQGEIINTWGTQDTPLALWFNYGTRDHGSLGDWPLHWIGKNGKSIYAMFVRGVPKTLAMEIGIALGKAKLKVAVPKFVKEQMA